MTSKEKQEMPHSELEAQPQVDENLLWREFWDSPKDSDARLRLVELYLPLVAKVASKMPFQVRQRVSLEELLSSGVVGLHDAISSFVPGKSAQFSTFAYKRIRGAMLDELRSQDPLTRTQRSYYREICAAINRLTTELARPPSDEELARATNLSISEVSRYIGMGSETVNLQDEFEDGLSYMDVLTDNDSQSPLELAHQSLALDRLREHFRTLDDREQKILFLRHYEDMSVKEIAKVLEISEGRISQIYQKIVIKLRALMHTDNSPDSQHERKGTPSRGEP